MGWKTVVPDAPKWWLRHRYMEFMQAHELIKQAADFHMQICKPSAGTYKDKNEEAMDLFLQHHAHLINAMDGIYAQALALREEGER